MKRILLALLSLIFLAAAAPPPQATRIQEATALPPIVEGFTWDQTLVNWHTSSLPSDQIKASFTSPEGVQFISYVTYWDEDDLKDLYEEFKKNLIGEEIRYLGKIVLSSETSSSVAGVYWPALSSNYKLATGRIIVLYNVGSKSRARLLSTLSHEYGHHFTYYWLLKNEGKLPMDRTTSWAKQRSLDGFPVNWSGNGAKYDHEWAPEEIMADEYAILFGSSGGHPHLYDTSQYDPSLIGRAENTDIPLPDNDDMRSYWLHLSGIDHETPTPLTPPKIEHVSLKTVRFESNQYLIRFTPATSDPEQQKRLQYIVRWKSDLWSEGASQIETGVKEIWYSRKLPNGWDNGSYDKPDWKGRFIVYAYDPKTGQLVSSKPAWYDFSGNTPTVMKSPVDPKTPELPLTFIKTPEYVSDRQLKPVQRPRR